MSVAVWKRNLNESERQLDIFIASRSLAKHVLEVTSNKNIFLVEYKESITDRLNNDILDVYLNLWKANKTDLNKDFTHRRELQNLALEAIVDFLAMWELAKYTFHLRHNKETYVIKHLLLIRDATKAWMKSDDSRV